VALADHVARRAAEDDQHPLADAGAERIDRDQRLRALLAVGRDGWTRKRSP
jgi:hypothetical protein